MLLNDFPQTDKRLAYLLGLRMQGYQGRGRSQRAGRLVMLSAGALLLLSLWMLFERH